MCFSKQFTITGVITQLMPFTDSSTHVSFLQQTLMKLLSVPSSVLKPGASRDRLVFCCFKCLCVLVSSTKSSPAHTSPAPELRIHRAKTTLSISPRNLMPSKRHLIGPCPDPDFKPIPPTALSIFIEAPLFFVLRAFFLESSMLSAWISESLFGN